MQLGFSLRFVTIIYKVEILRVSADWMDKKQLGEKIFLKIVWMFEKISSHTHAAELKRSEKQS